MSLAAKRSSPEIKARGHAAMARNILSHIKRIFTWACHQKSTRYGPLDNPANDFAWSTPWSTNASAQSREHMVGIHIGGRCKNCPATRFERLAAAAEATPSTLVTRHLIRGLKIRVSVVQIRPWAPLFQDSKSMS